MIYRDVAFTGARLGMTTAQVSKVRALLRFYTFRSFHHGNCIGADEQAAALAKEVGITPIVSHPCTITDMQSAFVSDDVRPVQKPLTRNQALVDECNCVLAAPPTREEQQRGGTWFTIRYARKQSKPLLIVYPDGGYEGTLKGQ